MSPDSLYKILSSLTLEEKIRFLSGVDWWRTPVIQRDGVFVPHIKVCLCSQFVKHERKLTSFISVH
jgi:hypothetical protein